jgi:hypothetical protein
MDNYMEKDMNEYMNEYMEKDMEKDMNEYMEEPTITSTDCLVLKIVETDTETRKSDTELYVIYDKMQERFMIRGKRRNTRKITSFSYSFNCDTAADVYDFIDLTICRFNVISYTLYNYDNLTDDNTFEFLHSCNDPSYEIVGYDNIKLSKNKKHIMKVLRSLREVYNHY